MVPCPPRKSILQHNYYRQLVNQDSNPGPSAVHLATEVDPTELYNDTCSTSSFQVNLGELVPERHTILDYCISFIVT